MEQSYLEQMKYKRVPKKQDEVVVAFPKDIEEGEGVEVVRKTVEIVDLRQKMDIDRSYVIKRLREKQALTVIIPTEASKRLQIGSEIITIAKPKIQKTMTTIVISPEEPQPVTVAESEEESKETELEPESEAEPEPSESEEPEPEPSESEAEPEPSESEAEPEPSESEEPEPVVAVPTKKTRKTKAKVTGEKAEKLTKTMLSNRLPKPEKIVVKTSPYYMTNRRMYIQKLRELFQPYTAEIEKMSESIKCGAESTDFKLLTHQKVVRDYLNLYTPYRGLLLYHGLGAGKTCTSIAIAEGMKSEKQIVLMTPASLKTNFFAELKKCGDYIYRKNQFWEFVRIEGQPGNIGMLSNALNIPRETIEKNGGAWLVDVQKPSNFEKLSTGDQDAIDEQLDMMIRAKYQDINYNGLNPNIVNRLTQNHTINPFDNKVVIIDEAHNFVSRIVNKIKKPNSVNFKLYNYLMKAQNARVVLLSGTPIINYPNEIAILFNMLRGAIKTWTIPIATKTERKINRDELLELFAKNNVLTYDYVEYGDNKLTITRNPFGFINMKKREKKGGADDSLFDNYMGGRGTTKKVKPKKSSHRITKKHKPEKPVESYTVKNGVIKIHHLPEEEIADDETVEYFERALKDQGFHDGGANEFEKYSGVKLDESGNITDAQFIAQIKRILTAEQMEVMEGLIKVDYNEILPHDAEAFMNMFIDTNTESMKNESVFKRRILGLTSYFRSAQEQLLPSFVMNEDKTYHIEKIVMSDHQFAEYVKVRSAEIEQEKRAKTQKRKQANAQQDDVFTMSSTYRIFSRACCNFAFPAGMVRPMPDRKQSEEEDDEDESVVVDAQSPVDEEEAPAATEPQVKYGERIQAALTTLSSGNYLKKDELSQCSPKFVKLLENIQNTDNSGLHLIYSQFRTIEGIGILKLILEANGFAEFKIRSVGGSWEIDEEHAEANAGKPHFVLYTGTESTEEKEIVRNIYNGTWALVPKKIADRLREKAANNNHGEIIKIFMITSSGAEGINLKNTRFVHIVEPYWHNVRLEQVIGRARRICSHQDLPEELRTVKVFLYVSSFSETQKTDKQNIEIMIHDLSRVGDKDNKHHPITTDESLFEIANIKTEINNHILKSIKESAIDCTLYKNDENLVCYGSAMGKITSNQFLSYPTLEMDQTEREELNVKKQTVKLTETKPINGIVYAADKKTGELFDLAKYKQGQMVKVGKLVKRGKMVEVEFDKK
jgi:hypothetical protein